MKQGKEVKIKETEVKDPEITGRGYDEFYDNILSLDNKIKNHLKSEGLDWRFINASQFRAGGNFSRSRWIPYNFRSVADQLGLLGGLNAEGNMQRGDLILATRTKKVSTQHREFIEKRNRQYAGFNKQQADELKSMAKDAGIKNAKVFEGYEDNE
jgi:hypothetical protein